ncbi:hypothetical protein HYC85_015272 [Camellia sinensis]|uniref:Uncharacterized protein n=1 Tax=Camellia sinensis TaxID=4442 RepID=A0A7J7GZX1_CAMSI|nr:hypothetical protein HYC85_015272 [Camellia sinensis]
MQRAKSNGGEMSKGLNPVAQLQAKFKELEAGFKAWLAKQSLPVEAAVVTTTSAAQGTAIGAFMGTLTNNVSYSFPTPPPNAPSALAGGPFVQAHNFAVMTGVNAGISCVMKRIRGKEDVQSRYVPNRGLQWEVECDGVGAASSASLFKITMGTGADEKDFYDVNIVDGYNLPFIAAPQGVFGVCNATGCVSDLNTVSNGREKKKKKMTPNEKKKKKKPAKHKSLRDEE